MSATEVDGKEAGAEGARDYPLKHTTELLNDRLRLYLSEDQRRGFATGLLIGTALGAALLAWNVATMVRRRL